jgi:hypothetical protein
VNTATEQIPFDPFAPSPETRVCPEPRHVGEVVAEITPRLTGPLPTSDGVTSNTDAE